MNRRKCEFCGEPISKSDTFCKSCGNSIKKSEVVQDAIIDDPNKSNKISINKDYIISAIALVLAIILIIALI